MDTTISRLHLGDLGFQLPPRLFEVCVLLPDRGDSLVGKQLLFDVSCLFVGERAISLFVFIPATKTAAMSPGRQNAMGRVFGFVKAGFLLFLYVSLLYLSLLCALMLLCFYVCNVHERIPNQTHYNFIASLGSV